jgi:6-phosphogluconolactonase
MPLFFSYALNLIPMNISRRAFAFLFSATSLALLSANIVLGQSSKGHAYLVFVGTYTDKTDSKGIYAFDFDASSGKLTPRGLAVETPNPSWLVIHPNGKWAYAANESGKQSTITAFSVDAKSARLTLLNQLPALGEDPCYLSFDKSGKYLFAANYTSGNVVVFPILPDGKLGEHSSAVKDAGPLGPNKERQEGPHAHWVRVFPGNTLLYVADLGLDRVLFYDFNASKGTLAVHDATVGPSRPFAQNTLDLRPGTGPRHVAIARSNSYRGYIYVLGEMDSTITVFAPTKEGILNPRQTLSTLPANFSGRNDAAEIALYPSGKWLFASNRGHDSIAVFAVDPSTGKLKPAGDYSTGGKEPRHFAIDPTGQFLLAENQNSNSIVVFRINPETGALSQISITEAIPAPVCLTFLRTP